MYIYNKKSNTKEKIIPSLQKIGLAWLVIVFALGVNFISGTNSFFTDEAEVRGIEFRAGKWIPTLEIEIDPEEPDSEDGWYSEAPCVKFFSDIEDVTIYYAFASEEEMINGEIEEDICVYPPVGKSELSAWAVNDENDNWISKTLVQEFKVGYEVKEGDVIINELMWMGGYEEEGDEWIELRNMTNREIDLSNWNIQFAGKGKSGHIEIPHGYSIKANGYFLLIARKWDDTAINLDEDLAKDEGYTHIAGMDLSDEGEQLILQDKNKKNIDEVWQDEKWPDGWHGIFLHMSMERDTEPGDGKNKSSWHTCLSPKCNNKDYWREEGLNFGTPGKENSSRIDLSSFGADDFEEKFLGENNSDSEELNSIWKNNFLEKNEEKAHKDNEPKENVARDIEDIGNIQSVESEWK